MPGLIPGIANLAGIITQVEEIKGAQETAVVKRSLFSVAPWILAVLFIVYIFRGGG